ncbi:MAG: hypothetical protein U0165_14375 [Polyangiaceae bacterium]
MDDSSTAISASGGQPLAGATRVVLVGRAFVSEQTGYDTSEITVETSVSSSGGASEQMLRTDDALRDAARRLGHALGERILGVPAVFRNGSRGLTDMLLSRP